MNPTLADLSVVIPTWNEEAWLPRLLQCLALRPVREMVVADHSSIDSTRSVARRFGCKIVEGGRPGVARNRGAAICSGSILLFADADVVIPTGVLEEIVASFNGKDVAAVHCRLYPLTTRRFVQLSFCAMHWYIRLMGRAGLAQGVGSLFAVRSTLFWGLGGFAEDVLAGEDVELFRRLGAVGRVVYRSDLVVPVSARRFSTERETLFVAKTLLWSVLRLLGVKASLVGYRWIPHDPQILREEALLLDNAGLGGQFDA